MTQPPSESPAQPEPTSTAQSSARRASSPRKLVWLVAGVAVVVLGVVAVLALGGGGSPGTAPPAVTPSATLSPASDPSTSTEATPTEATSEPTASATPTEVVETEEVSSNEEMLDLLFQDVLGPSNRGVDRVSSVKLDESSNAGDLMATWAINRNPTAAKLKSGAWGDVRKILAVVQDSGVPVGKITLVGTYAEGAGKDSQVLKTIFSWVKVKKLDLGSASPSSLNATADAVQAQAGWR